MTNIETMKLAMDALADANGCVKNDLLEANVKAIAALRQAISEAESLAAREEAILQRLTSDELCHGLEMERQAISEAEPKGNKPMGAKERDEWCAAAAKAYEDEMNKDIK